MKHFCPYFFMVLILIGIVKADWSYNFAFGVAGTTFTDSTCYGNYQNPIKLTDTEAVDTAFWKEHYGDHDFKISIQLNTLVGETLSVDTNKYVQINIEGEPGYVEIGSTLEFSSDNEKEQFTPYQGKYIPEKIIFHSPSEHYLENNQQDLEMQIICRIYSGDCPQDYIILSVLFETDTNTDDSFIASLNPDTLTEITSEDSNLKNLMMTTLGGELYIVDGSFTIPDCATNVKWIIFKNVVPMSTTQLDYFTDQVQKFNIRAIMTNFNLVTKYTAEDDVITEETLDKDFATGGGEGFSINSSPLLLLSIFLSILSLS